MLRLKDLGGRGVGDGVKLLYRVLSGALECWLDVGPLNR